MAESQPTDRADYDPLWITAKALERHFSMQDALFEFSRLFQDEHNDRALAIGWEAHFSIPCWKAS